MSETHDRLVQYAMGILDKEDQEEMEQELASQGELRAQLSEVHEILDKLNDVEPPMYPRPELRDRLLKSLDGDTRFEGFVERLAVFFDLTTSRIRELLEKTNQAPRQPWAPSGIPGIHLLHFDGGERVAEADCGLVYLEQGSTFPEHRHQDTELAIVIEGEILEAGGLVYRPGDLSYKPKDSTHSFRASDAGPAIVAVIVRGLEIL